MKKFVLFLTLLPFFIHAQVSPQWVDRFDGAGDYADRVNAMTKDGSGNYYLAGYSTRSNNQKDFLVMKINVNGDTLWTWTYDGTNHTHDEAFDIAYDANGFVYACGFTESNGQGSDMFLVKLDLLGDSLWTRTYNYLANENDIANAVAVDAGGNVVITGQSDNDSTLITNDDYITIRYSPAGVQSYAVRYNGLANGTDRAVDVVMQSNGNAVVTGRCANFDDDFVTKCYSTTGTVVWTAIFDGLNGNDHAVKMDQDAAGNIFVTGNADNGSDYDYVVLEYNSSGIEQWQSWFDYAGGNDYPSSVTHDNAGNIIVAGRVDVTPLTPSYDILSVEFDATGNQQWTAQFNGPGNGDDDAGDVVADASGNIYLTGKVDMNANVLIIDNDIITLSFDNSGNLRWQHTSGNVTNPDAGAALTLDASTNVIVAANATANITGRDIRRIKYNSTGVLAWSKDYNGTGDHNDVTNAMTVDANGNSYMCGYTYSAYNKRDMCVVKVSPAGTTLWSATINGSLNLDDEATGVAVDASGNVIITGYTKDTITGYAICTAKYSSAGVMMWTTKYNFLTTNQNDKGTGVVVNSSGEIFVTGESDGNATTVSNYDIVTIKYNSGGTQQWAIRYNGPGNTGDKPSAIGIAPSGNIVVVGKVGISALDDNAFIVEYTNAGTQVFAYNYPSAYGNDNAVDLAFNSVGDIAVAVKMKNISLNDDMGVWYFDAAGNGLWMTTYNGTGNGNDAPAAIAFDNSGNIFLAGQTDVDTASLFANYDAISIKYNGNGVQQWVKTVAGAAGDDDNAVDVVIDNSTGNVYVAAQIQNGTLLVKNNDLVVLQYDPAGNQMLTSTYDAFGKSDGASAMQISGNNIYVAGFSTGAANAQKDMVMLLYSGFNVGINENEIISSLDVFPVPCTDHISIRMDDAKEHTIMIFDVNGKKVFETFFTGKEIAIETAELSPGIYSGTVLSNDGNKQFFRFVRE
ncbi:MAG: hypothetical protein HY064_15570 [Bacteroidetes bacterium]|nr:hypothetical protein [Bacteroidota bacterium]